MVPIDNMMGDYLVLLKLNDGYFNPIVNNTIFLLFSEEEFFKYANSELRMLKKIFDCSNGQDVEARIIMHDDIKKKLLEDFINTHSLIDHKNADFKI